MKNRGMSGINLLVSMVAGIIFLLVIIAIITKGTFAFDNTIFNSLGKCQAKCDNGDIVFSKTCKENGKLVEGTKRCFGISDLWTADSDKDDKDDGKTNNTISSGGEVLEARLGANPLDKYMRSTPRTIEANSGPWKFSVWGARGTAYFCEIRFFKIDSNNNQLSIPDGNFLKGKDVPEKICVDPRSEVHKDNEEYKRANVINMQLDPKKSDVGKYKISLILRDKKKKAVASEILSLTVSDTTCPYTSCDAINSGVKSLETIEDECNFALVRGCNFQCEFIKETNTCQEMTSLPAASSPEIVEAD